MKGHWVSKIFFGLGIAALVLAGLGFLVSLGSGVPGGAVVGYLYLAFGGISLLWSGYMLHNIIILGELLKGKGGKE